MQREAVLARPGRDRLQAGLRVHEPAQLTDGVLDPHQALTGVVRVAGVAQVEIKQLGLEHAAGAGQHPRLHPCESGHTALLVHHHVGLLVHEHLVAGPGVRAGRDQIPHGTGRDVHGGFLAEHRRDLRLQRDHRGIVTPDIVADFRLRHRAAHLRRRPGNGVRTEVQRRHGGSVSRPEPGSNR